MKKKVIINIATEYHSNGQRRLMATLENRYDGDILFWTKESDVGAPLHTDNPYAFKIYAFEKAKSLGYKNILWLDASVYCVNDVQPVFDIIEKEGYIMQYAGQKLGAWANDNCLEYFNLTRDDAMDIICYGNAGFLGLNFDFEISNKFFELWKKAAIDGIFKGAWNNNNKTESKDERCKGHRHDLTCGSIIAHKLGMEYKKGTEWLQYAAPDDAVLNDTIIFKAQGIN